MKVTYEKSFSYQLLKQIESLPDQIIVRADVDPLGSPRQISRALKKLVTKGSLIRLGYGVYAKLTRSRLTGMPYLQEGFLAVARNALTKLNVGWEPSQEEQEYNTGRSTQVPVRPVTQVKKRFRRKLRYQTMEFKIG